MKKLLLFLLPLLLFFSCTRPVVTVESLLTEMTDREAITKFPKPAFSLKQFSSYDRATTAPGDYTWFANWDRSMFIRTDTIAGRQEYVMMDCAGPGTIVRFWMTFAGENSGKGILRIYFDGDSVPAIEGTAFDVLSGTAVTAAPLASSVSDSTEYERRGHNLYLPLPYARHCKVTYQSENIRSAGAKKGGEACYYNINYRTYSDPCKVVTWSPAEMEKASATLARVQQELESRYFDLASLQPDSLSLPVALDPGASLSDTIFGKRAIRLLRFAVSPDVKPQHLRSTIIEISFDGERTVWCPLGDFFGTGYLLRHSNTWFTSVDPSGILEARWVMPFKKSAVITLHNLGKEPVALLAATAFHSSHKWSSTSMHFGTAWHQFTHIQTGGVKTNEGQGGASDINYVKLNGTGVYVSDGIALFNTAYGWWGEGDEKVFVDGETFPSSIGTGTEDYYGYAWCRPEKFANHPFIAQPDGSGNFWPGYSVNMRHRSLDAIPFNDSLRFDMEMWHWNKTTINHAVVTRWYAKPGATANLLPDTAGVTEPVALKRSDIISPWIVNGKIEGENMVLDGFSGGNLQYQTDEKHGWSGDQQAFWTRTKAGDHLDFSFYSRDSINANLTARLTRAADYGRVRILLNGKPAGAPLDLIADKVTTADYNLGNHTLRKGRNLLRIEITGTSAPGGKAFFGLDYLSMAAN